MATSLSVRFWTFGVVTPITGNQFSLLSAQPTPQHSLRPAGSRLWVGSGGRGEKSHG
jgi:hypothetical protein